MTREIGLANGRGAALVDAKNYIWLSQYSWRLHSKGYATAWVDGHWVYMHRLISGVPAGVGVDHRNRNKLDNREENLRRATGTQNNANRAAYRTNTSGFKGVFWDKRYGKWLAQVMSQGRQMYLGRYTDKVDAARAYDAAALKLFGEFAALNFPQGA